MPILLPKKPDRPRKKQRELRPVRPNRSVRKAYEDVLVQQVDILKAQTRNLSDLVSSGAARVSVAERLGAFALSTSQRLLGMATQAARTFVGMADRSQKKQLESNISRALGVDFARIMDGPGVAEAVDLAISWNTSLIKSIGSEHWDKVGAAVLDNYRGVPLPEGQSLTQRLMQIGGVTENRAKFIARDQTSKLTAALTKTRMQENGIDSYTWRNAGDTRVVGNPGGKYPDPTEGHGNHWDREGKVFTFDNPPSDGAPGEAYNCFPGSVKVNGFPFLQKLYRRKFSGALTELFFSNGKRLSATPNHPVLTSRGVLPFKDVRPGDNIIRRVHKRLDGVDDDSKSFDVSFEQIFRASLLVGVLDIVPIGHAGQFHGDGTDAEIDVVTTNCQLILEADARARKVCGELGFTESDMMIGRSFLSGHGSFCHPLRSWNDAKCGSVRSADLISSLLISHLGPLERFGFALAPNVNSGGFEVSPDDISRDTEVLRNTIFAYTALVHGDDFLQWQRDRLRRGVATDYTDKYSSSLELSANKVRVDVDGFCDAGEGESFLIKPLRVVDSRVRNHFGHVFNLQTVSGYYTAESAEVGNCRCVMRATLDIDKLKAMYA